MLIIVCNNEKTSADHRLVIALITLIMCHDPLPVGTFPAVEESQNSQGGEVTEEPRNVKYCTITYLLSRLQHELKSTEALRETSKTILSKIRFPV